MLQLLAKRMSISERQKMQLIKGGKNSSNRMGMEGFSFNRFVV